MFFPLKGDAKSGNDAVLTCFSCSVRPECKAYKLRTGSTDGIWGGEFPKRGKS